MIGVVTDSSCDLPTVLVSSARIVVVPLTVRFGSEEFVDGVDISPPQFWSRLRTATQLPETAAPSVGGFMEAYANLRSGGATGAIAICLSTELSGTYQAAVLAAERVEGFPVKVVDSRAVSMALGLQVLDAATHAAAGASLAEVAQAAQANPNKANLLAALDTVEYLRRGGRIGGAQAFIGSLLNVKPLITFKDGVVAAAGRVRTRSKAIEALLDRVRQLAPRIRSLSVIHGGAGEVDSFVDSVSQAAGRPALAASLGPVVGTHSGPGVLGVAYLLD
jgi:DegV family protein with EDD domain